jgi:rhomboid protease GluP
VEYEASRRSAAGGESVREDETQAVVPPPWVRRRGADAAFTKVLFGINVAVFAAMALATISATGNLAGLIDPDAQQLYHWGANFGPSTINGQWWRLLTCLFIHVGVIHLAVNMWCLWSLGSLAESLFGGWTFVAVYLISGLGASVTSTGWHPARLSAGASGAIFGIAGALIAAFQLGKFSAPRSVIRSALRNVVTFAVYNLIFGAAVGRIDNTAHFGGLVTGLVLGALLARFASHSDAPVRRLTVLCGVLLAVVLAAALWLPRRLPAVSHQQRLPLPAAGSPPGRSSPLPSPGTPLPTAALSIKLVNSQLVYSSRRKRELTLLSKDGCKA